MGTFLLLLILCFVVWPLVRVFWKLYMLHRQARQVFTQMHSRTAGHEPEPRRAGWSTPAPRRKKIAKDVGEYVAYETVSVTVANENTAGRGDTDTGSTIAESRVTDVEWEDVK